jgi:hypothetical protein
MPGVRVYNTGNDASGDGSEAFPFLTLAKALSVCINGDTIYVSAGEYNIFPAITKSVTIKGPNAGISGSDTTRLGEAVFKDIASTSITSNDVTIDGLKILQTGGTLDLFTIQSNGVTIQNCIFERNAVTAGQIARAIVSSNDPENYLIKNNLFTGSTDGGLFSGHKTWNNGIFLNNNQRKTGTVEGNTFKNLRAAINLDDNNSLVTLKSNNLLNCGTYISYGGSTPPSEGANTLDNIFDMNNSNTLINNSNVNALFKTSISNNKFKFGDVSLSSSELSLEQKFTIESKILHKGKSSRKGIVYFKDNEQFVISGLTTITTSLNFAPASGETIYLSAGTYTEDVLINKQVTLSGVDKITTIIQSSNSSIVPPVQITDNSSNSQIKNLTVKGNILTQTITGSGNSDNNKSGVLILNTVNNPEINNIIFDNLIISNASNGIAFNNKFSKNILIKNCEIKNNEGSGIRIASNVEMLDEFTVDNCIIKDNNLNAIASNPSGLYRPDCTNFVIKSSTIQNNNLLTTNNSHDLSFFGFNGNIEINDTVITSNHKGSKLINGTVKTIGGWGLIIYGSNASSVIRDSGNIKISNVKMSGTITKAAFGIERYINLGTIDIQNLDLKDCAHNAAEQTWLQVAIGHQDNDELNLSNIKLHSLYVSNSGSVDVRNAEFFNSDGVKFNLDNIDILIEVSEKYIYDKNDNYLIGRALLPSGASVITPTSVGALNEYFNKITSGTNEIILTGGIYTLTEDLIVNGNTPIELIVSEPTILKKQK